MLAVSPRAAISSTDPKNTPRDRQNKPQTTANNGGLQRKPRPTKNVPSRYLSPSPSQSTTTTATSTSSSSSSSSAILRTSKRYPSPLLSRTTNSASNLVKTPSSLPKRSQSVDRRRPSATSVTDTEMSAATKMLITSTRSLSVSFQGESFSLPISKKKETATPISHRKSTPERRRSTPVRDQRENSKPIDHQLWPGASRSKTSESVPNPLFRSVHCNSDSSGKFGSGFVGTSILQHSVVDQNSRVPVDGKQSLGLGGDYLEMRDGGKTRPSTHSRLASRVSCDFTASDTDSVSSGSTNGAQECGSGVNGEISKTRSLPRNSMASAKFWLETNSRLRRLQDPGSPRCSSPSSGISSMSPKFNQSKRFSSDSPLASSPRGMASPIRGSTRPASPSKLWAPAASSSARALSSPSRVRNGVAEEMNAYNRTLPSILCFSADIRRGKIGEGRVVDAHLLRLLYNRYLQWRFANARAESTLIVQRLIAEKSLWNAWVLISDLRHCVILKRIKLLLLRQKLKLASVLKGQMGYLEEWSLLDRDHSNFLSGAIEALKASTLRLPVIGKAVVDIHGLKHAISSAVDVMHAMVSTIFSLSSKRCLQGNLERHTISSDHISYNLYHNGQCKNREWKRTVHSYIQIGNAELFREFGAGTKPVLARLHDNIIVSNGYYTNLIEDLNSVIAEMVNITTKEKVLLGQCQGFLSRVEAMEVTDCSMKTHIIQLSRI